MSDELLGRVLLSVSYDEGVFEGNRLQRGVGRVRDGLGAVGAGVAEHGGTHIGGHGGRGQQG